MKITVSSKGSSGKQPARISHSRPRRLAAAACFAAIPLAVFAAGPSLASEESPSWFERIDFSGDFRGRDELFVIDGIKDRHRLRYRFRAGAKTEVNDHIKLGFRLATGPDANSGNQTLGAGTDFDPDGIFVDQAYITLAPHGAEKPMFGDSFSVTFGKMPNPFEAKGVGPALLIWDGDQMPEGAALSWGAKPSDSWSTNLDVAYYVIDENSVDPSRDPNIIGVQLDNDVKISEQIQFKSHVSYFALRKLDSDFFDRTVAGGSNSFGGNTAGLTSNNHIDVLEFHGGTTFTGHEDWPITIWGNVVYNASADGVGEGKQNLGYGVGIETGNKKTYAQIGVAYFAIEADAVPADLADSDLFDGNTNGEGFLVYLTRQLWTNTDFDIRAYFGDELDSDVSDLQAKTPDDRIRVQTNIIVKF